MTRLRTPQLLCASALSLAIVAVPALPAFAGDAAPTVTKDGSTYTLKVLETDTGSGATYTPKGGEPTKEQPKGEPGVGDAFGFAAALTQGATKVGTDAGTCTFLKFDAAAQSATSHCRVTLTFADGTITVDDTVDFSDSANIFKIAIASGTGAYEGAKGAVTVNDLPDDSGDQATAAKPDLTELTAVYTLDGSQVSEVPTGGAATGGGLAPGSSDTAMLIGLGGVVALLGFGALAGGRTLARRD
jgi:hypothetical protein